MGALPPNIILPLDDTHANIPVDTTRETLFDSMILKITTSDWGDTGGNATHFHNSPAHSHVYVSDSHTQDTGTITGNVGSIGSANHKSAPEYDIVTQAHFHDSVTSGVMTGETITTDQVTVDPVSNDVSKYDLIFIRTDKWLQLPENSIVMRSNTVARNNATHFDSLDGRYMKGAGTGADAGNPTTVTDHFHTTYHEHTETHDHASVGVGNVPSGRFGADNLAGAKRDHGHSVSFGTSTEVVTNSDNTSTTTPGLAYQELHFWKLSQDSPIEVGDIVIFTGSELPNGWDDLGYADVYPRGKATGESLTTGGSNTHGHDDNNHLHAGSPHTHPWTTNTVTADGNYRSGSTPMAGTHEHIGTTTSEDNPDTALADATFDDSNHEPPYVKVRLIQATAKAMGSGASVIPRIMAS